MRLRAHYTHGINEFALCCGWYAREGRNDTRRMRIINNNRECVRRRRRHGGMGHRGGLNLLVQ